MPVRDHKILVRVLLCPSHTIGTPSGTQPNLFLNPTNSKTMKYINIFTISTVALLFPAALTNSSAAPGTIDWNAAPEKGFVLLELFTSEGCSSCPAADELMVRMQKESQEQDLYILTYHVDYWDRLGWRDAFSSPQFSQRQRKYAQWLGDPQIYTPQLVINGKSSCVGSDEVTIKAAEKNARSTSATSVISVQGRQVKERMIFKYRLKGSNDPSQLLIAVVQKHAVTKVKRGENGGRTLSHVQVVRSLSSFDVPGSGEGEQSIMLPEGFNTQYWEIIAMIQNAESGEIAAVTRVELDND